MNGQVEGHALERNSQVGVSCRWLCAEVALEVRNGEESVRLGASLPDVAALLIQREGQRLALARNFGQL
jgi:hypothetical protein